MSKQLTFKCKCGKVEASILNDFAAEFNCHCHSCVASARFVEAKPTFNGYSGLIDSDGGFAYAIVKGKDIDFTSDIMSEEAMKNIDFVKVGETGKVARAYCKGCGTLLGGFQKNVAFLNRNCMFDQSGSPYKPTKSVMNIMKKHAFEPDKVPDPSAAIMPFRAMLTFVPLMIGFGGGNVADKDSALLRHAGKKELSGLEVVPITWE